MALTDTIARLPAAADSAVGRRRTLARQVVAQLRRGLPAGGNLELTLAGEAPPTPSTAARNATLGTQAASVVVSGPDAVGRFLWPPSADALGEAYLRGDLDIEGDIWTASWVATSFQTANS